MTVKMILPGIETGVLHTGQRVATFTSLKRMNMLTATVMITLKADLNGIICVTFTT
jgi:hypothetical protein